MNSDRPLTALGLEALRHELLSLARRDANGICGSALLFGLTGVGKTTLARDVAHALGVPLYTVQYTNLFSRAAGEMQARLHRLTEEISAMPNAVVFFDDFDMLGAATARCLHGFIPALVRLLQALRANESTCLLLAATHAPWRIDPALVSNACFERQLYVPLPDEQARTAMLRQLLGAASTAPDLDFGSVSAALCGYTGVDIVCVAEAAKTAAIGRTLRASKGEEINISPVATDDLLAAALARKSSVDPPSLDRLRSYAAQRGLPFPDKR